LYNYLRTLHSFNQQKDDLNDPGKYYLTPCRYISGNKELGDSRVPWKLVKQPHLRRSGGEGSHPTSLERGAQRPQSMLEPG